MCPFQNRLNRSTKASNMFTSNLRCVSPCRSQTSHALQLSSALSGEVEPKSIGLLGLAVELPSLVDSLRFKHLIGQQLNADQWRPPFHKLKSGPRM